MVPIALSKTSFFIFVEVEEVHYLMSLYILPIKCFKILIGHLSRVSCNLHWNREVAQDRDHDPWADYCQYNKKYWSFLNAQNVIYTEGFDNISEPLVLPTALKFAEHVNYIIFS